MSESERHLKQSHAGVQKTASAGGALAAQL